MAANASQDCAGLTGNRVIGQPSRLSPPQGSVPSIFLEDFRRGGATLLGRYEAPTQQTWAERCSQWGEAAVDGLMRLLRAHEHSPEPVRWMGRPGDSQKAHILVVIHLMFPLFPSNLA